MEVRQTVQIPLSSGLQQKGDKRAQDPPALDKCVDAEFDDVGGLRTRKPYASLGVNILGGGTLSNIRKLTANGSELLCFTKDALYSWSTADSAWVLKGTHLAVKVAEESIFSTTGDQFDCDRAELSGTAVYSWSDGSDIWVAARNTTSKAVVCAPTKLASASRARLVACTTKILLTYITGGNLVVLPIDPANVSTSLAGSPTTVVATVNSYYDVTQIIGSDAIVGAIRMLPTTSYKAFKVTSAIVVSAITKARTCDGPIAVSCTPDGLHVQIVRGNGTNVQGDLLTISALVDVFTGQAIGSVTTSLAQIAAAHRSVQDSAHYRCYVFWSEETGLAASAATLTHSNWVDDNNNLGTAANFVRFVGIGSRAFDRDGHVYVWLVFGQPSGFQGDAATTPILFTQNSFFLYRDDGFLAAKAAYREAGGLRPTIGQLSGVYSADGTTYRWCATDRNRFILANKGDTYSDRGPRDVTFTFDSNEARRCVRLGRTMYIACGEGLLQYDGVQLTEAGFHIYPWYFDNMKSGAGSVATGTYGRQNTWRWENAVGETDRSTTASVGTATMTGGPAAFATASWSPLSVTHKTTPAVAVECWRTAVDPTADAPMYLISSSDPTNATNPNRYIPNDGSLQFLVELDDAFDDATLTGKIESPENDGVLDNIAPPPSTLAIATVDRVFLSGIANQPDAVWYSKQRNDGEVVAFNDALTVTIPAPGGSITGMALLNETLIVFRENAIYALQGTGFDNTGGGNNYGPATLISSDIGSLSQESIAVIPDGLLFQSHRGWYLLNRGWGLTYVGAGVATYDTETPLSVDVITAQHQVRIATSNRVLVWDTLVNQWGEWSVANAIGSVVWSNVHYYATATTVMAQQSDFSTATNYGMDIETSWFKPSGLTGAMKARWIMPLGEYRSACSVRIRVARNYQSDGAGGWSYFDDKYRSPATTVGGALQVRMGPSIPGMEAIKVRLTIESTSKNGTAPTGEGAKLTGIGLEFGISQGLYKLLAQAQKV